jgi:hypothetical protein
MVVSGNDRLGEDPARAPCERNAFSGQYDSLGENGLERLGRMTHAIEVGVEVDSHGQSTRIQGSKLGKSTKSHGTMRSTRFIAAPELTLGEAALIMT